MLANRKHVPGLARRVAVFHVLFGLLAVICLAAAALLASQRVLQARAEGNCLATLGRASSAVTLAHLRGESLQPIVERVSAEGGLKYCSVVSPDGRILAHSQRSLVGKQPEPAISRERVVDDIERLRYRDAEGSRVTLEYLSPLASGEQSVGTLRLGTELPGLAATCLHFAEFAPLAVLAPLACLALGAWVLQRCVSPLADIEPKLRRLAFADQIPELARVPVRGAASLGWNRLVERFKPDETHEALVQRVARAAQNRTSSALETAVHCIGDGLAVTDMEGRIEFANAAISAILGADGDENSLAGAEFAKLLTDDERTKCDDALLDRAASARTIVGDLRRNDESGERVLRAARHPLRGENGQAGYVWSIRDVTQQRLADQMRDQFLDAATHELRTPLANIKAYAETLTMSDTMDVEQQKDFCNTINSEATRLARLIDDLLDLSSMEVGSLSIKRQNVEIERLMNEVVDKVRPLMDQKHIDFETAFPAKLPELKLDKDKINTTLVNLLGNAAKYTPEGGRVALKVKSADGSLVIDVEDTGVGITAEELPRVFEKFFRSADPRVQKECGTGLGLPLAREVVRLHGGELTATSQLNKGSTFTVTLPLKKE